MSTWDVAVVGAGLVGLATAHKLLERAPGLRLLLLDKEQREATHQSGRNSGVLHSGIYYKPGSLRARLCVRGKAELESFCAEHGIALVRNGKVITARADVELPRLEALAARGEENGVPCRLMDRGELGRIEPEVRGLAALHVPGTASVDFSGVARALRGLIEGRARARVRTGLRLTGIHPGERELRLTLRATGATSGGAGAAPETIRTRLLIACCGLHSDRIAALGGLPVEARILPFRGEYHGLAPAARSMVRGHIYPLPDPRFPFLGVHLSPTVHGEVACGPNAVLALGRESYRWTDLNPGELSRDMTSRAFASLAFRYPLVGAREVLRSFSKSLFLRDLQGLVPALRAEHLVPYRSGVRAMAVTPSGELVDDFVFAEGEAQLHVLNAPSPAATSCLAIGDELAQSAAERIGGIGEY